MSLRQLSVAKALGVGVGFFNAMGLSAALSLNYVGWAIAPLLSAGQIKCILANYAIYFEG